MNTYYACVRDDLVAAYQRAGNDYAYAYADWQAAATGAAKPGFHSNRYLMTYVNDVGIEQYPRYSSTDVIMPVGTKIAKESFKIRGKGRLVIGPLFFMEKLDADAAPESGGWRYSAVRASGKPMKVSQKFCYDCHKTWSDQDALGYPALEVRIR